MLLNVLFLLIGFGLLIKGADFLVLGSSSLARRLNISELIIGLTIVAFGTSTPELIVSMVAAFRGLNDVAFGNVIGSNIFNIFFVLPISALIQPLPYQLNFNTDITVLVASTVILLFFTYSGKKAVIERWQGLLLVLGFIGYTLSLILAAG